MGIEIVSGLQTLAVPNRSRSQLTKSSEWQEIIRVMTSRGLEPGEQMLVTISSETQGLVKNAGRGLKQLLLSQLEPLWKEGSAPRFRITLHGKHLLIEYPAEERIAETPNPPDNSSLKVLSTIQRLIGSRPARSPLLNTPEWSEIIEAVIGRGLQPGELLRVRLSAETRELLKTRSGGLKRLLDNGLRPLWNEGLIPHYKITQTRNSITIQNCELHLHPAPIEKQAGGLLSLVGSNRK